MPSGDLQKAARESAAARATNSEGLSGIHLETVITCTFTAEVFIGLLTACHFSVSIESVDVPMDGSEQAGSPHAHVQHGAR